MPFHPNPSSTSSSAPPPVIPPKPFETGHISPSNISAITSRDTPPPVPPLPPDFRPELEDDGDLFPAQSAQYQGLNPSFGAGSGWSGLEPSTTTTRTALVAPTPIKLSTPDVRGIFYFVFLIVDIRLLILTALNYFNKRYHQQ